MNDEDWIIEPGRGIGPLELGLHREALLQRLADAGLDVEDDEERWLYIEEMDADLTFSAGAEPVLQEVAISDDRARFGPMVLIDEPLAKIVDLLRVANEDTAWTIRFEEDPEFFVSEKPAADEAESPDAPSTLDKKLLCDGTLWIKSLGVGLRLAHGEILTVRLRQPGDLPQIQHGPLTDEQRELAEKPDLYSQLVGPTSSERPTSWFQRLAGLALVVGIGVVIWRGVDYQRRWNEAPTVEGKVIRVSPPPPEPFPDQFTIAYQDQQGRQHQVVLDYTEIFSLSKIGDKVELRYLPEAPDKPMGPAAAASAAFDTYIPWGIGVVVSYFVLQLVAGIISLLPSKKAAA
jgi:hypothetical protein